MSDRVIPRSFRLMEGLGPHVPAREREGTVHVRQVPLEAQPGVAIRDLERGAQDKRLLPDFHRPDLWDAITTGNYSEWELGLQLFDEEFADRFSFDVLTLTVPSASVTGRPRASARLVLGGLSRSSLARTESGAFASRHS